ncbi:MAG: RloB domain-containing protein [Bacteroidales bacterium]|nr:RloB domain-containing protein [Bacteroidales bacterium]
MSIKDVRGKRKKPSAQSGRKNNNKSNFYRFFIACEGEKTEVNYFKSLINTMSHVIELDKGYIQGFGMSEKALLDKADKIKKELERNNNFEFDSAWIVFDKDNFKSDLFNAAINESKNKDFKSAWTNEAFELWYLLHFNYVNTGMSRDQYGKKLTEIIKVKGEKGFKYKKNDEHIYRLLQKHGNEGQAIRYAQKLRQEFYNQKYADHNPCTWVDELVKEIKGVNDDEFKIKEPKDFFSEMQKTKNCY